MKRAWKWTILAACAVLAFPVVGDTDADRGEEERAWTVEEAFDAAAAWDFGDDEGPLEAIRAAVVAVQHDPEARAPLAQQLAALLEQEPTDACVVFVSDQLNLIGGPAEVPALAPLLTDPRHSARARYALEVIHGAVVDEALLAAFEEVDGELRAGIVGTMGRRGSAVFTPVVGPLLSEDGPAAVAAALAYPALEGASLHTVEEALLHGAGQENPLLYDAFITLAQQGLVGEASDAAVFALAQVIGYEETPPGAKFAAIQLLVEGDPESALDFVAILLQGDDSAHFRAGLQLVVHHPDEATVTLAGGVFDKLDSARQANLLGALGIRGSGGALPIAEAAFASEDEAVRVAAIGVLGQLGGPEAVGALLGLLADGTPADRRTARAALVDMPGTAVDGRFIDVVQDQDHPHRDAAVDILAERGATEAVAVLLAVSRDDTENIRREAVRALGTLLPDTELGGLASLLRDDLDEELRREVENALTQALRRSGEEAGAEVLQEMHADADVPLAARQSVIQVLGNLGAPSSLPVLREALASEEAEIQAAALAALSAWPDATPREDLIAFARVTESEAQRNEALEGYVRMLRMAGRQGARHLEAYTEIAGMTDEVRVLRAVLAGLGEVRVDGALELIEKLGEQSELAREAAVAAELVQSRRYRVTASHNTEAARNVLDGQSDTRWHTGTAQRPGQWFQVDLGGPMKVRGVVLDAAGSPNDYPRGYELYAFTDEDSPGEPVATGTPERPAFTITFEPRTVRYLRIVQTGESDEWFWAIHQLRIRPAH